MTLIRQTGFRQLQWQSEAWLIRPILEGDTCSHWSNLLLAESINFTCSSSDVDINNYAKMCGNGSFFILVLEDSFYLQDPSFGTLALESADSVDAAPSPTWSTPSALAHFIVHVVNIVVAAGFHHIAV